MISEKDLEDWDFDQLRVDATSHAYGYDAEAEARLCKFINQAEKLARRGRKQVAALFKPLEDAE